MLILHFDTYTLLLRLLLLTRGKRCREDADPVLFSAQCNHSQVPESPYNKLQGLELTSRSSQLEQLRVNQQIAIGSCNFSDELVLAGCDSDILLKSRLRCRY